MASEPISPQKRILQRKQALWNDRSSFDAHARDISDFLLPRAARFDTSDRNSGGASAYNEIIDEWGTQAHGTLAAGLMAGMTSPARPWFRLATPDRDMMEYGPVKTWLHRVTQKALAIFAASNTYRALHSTYEQLGAFPCGASIVVDNFDTVLHHYPLVFGSYAVGLDQWGRADTLYRELTKTVGQLVGEFGRDACSQSVRNLYDRGNYDAAVPIIHAVEPRRDREYGRGDARNMPFKSCYLEAGADGERQYLRESGFREFPAIVARWIVDGDDTYASRWPAAVALGSIKQLQQEQLRKSTAIDYQTDPPLQVPIAYRNQELDRLPGGVMYVDMASPAGGIRSAFEVNLNLQHLLMDIQDVRQRIDRSFFVDLFKMIANDTRSNITAREIAERHEEKLLMIGPVLERLHNEMLKPLIDITFAKMLRAGLFAPDQQLAIPRELSEQDLEVDFVSTLAQAQRAVGVQSIDRMIGTVASVAGLKPDVLDKLDFDQAVDVYADALGVDPSLIVADDKVALIRKGRAQQQQQAQMAAMAAPAKDAAQAAQAMSQADPQALASLFSGYSIPGVAQ